MIMSNIPNVVEKIREHLLNSRKAYAPRCNYASSAGHPCQRKLVYDRLNWQEKLLMEPHAVMRVEDGHRIEEGVIQKMRDSGFDVIEQQRPLEWPELELSGRIEGQIKTSGESILFEIKSMDSYDVEGIDRQEDLKDHRKWWFRQYYAQFQLYLFLLNKEWGIFIMKPLKGLPKQIVIAIDYEYAESVAKKLEAVNKCIKEKTYPDRIEDKTVCGMCDFRHICLPDEASASINILENVELLEALEEREKLKEAAKSYEAVDKKIKDMLESTSEGTHLVGGKFQVKIQVYERKFANVPDEIKKKYEEIKTASRVTITALK